MSDPSIVRFRVVVQAGEPLDLVRDPVTQRRSDLGEIEPVLDDDAQVDAYGVAVAPDLDPAPGAIAWQQAPEPARRHADDPIRLGRHVAHDL